ncbi:hypothetical protein ASE73_02735 [Sphingomonas sp. Leaf24]|uniref:spike base protein, RCAP_Rcc01079 family n=1 Tax=unclassified Sphingomonas TaxID=196159 RepID=UPI0007000A74|nr:MULTISPECIES: hypothetical protein [unclassified Sphingomonas]KQM23158.1 hypothetical protein ASE50_02735 [Sphingomonas sp. Leaf5]KQM96016.1 hypothetical protein ASE73_02735 [Sphingomonas sp. Leaf24]
MDRFANVSDTPDSPARRWAVITPSNSADLPELPKALRFNVGGTVVLRGEDGKDVSFTVSDGETLPVRPLRILATGTTATGIVAFY